MTKAQFLSEYPEFSEERAPDDLISAKLAQANARTPSVIWLTNTDQGVGLLAAHLISTSPWGQQARLAAADGSTTYSRERERLERLIGAGGAVL